MAALATRKQNQRKKTEAQSLLPCCAHSPVPQAEKGGGGDESSSGDQTGAYPEPVLF